MAHQSIWIVSLTLVLYFLALPDEAALAASGSVYLNSKPGCNVARATEIDQYLMKLIGFGPKGRKFPENPAQLKPYCEETAKMVTKIDSYVKSCFRKDLQSLAKVVIFSVKRSLRLFCSKRGGNKHKAKLDKLLSLAPCINTIIKDQTCLKLFVDKTRQLIPLPLENDKIKYVCCNYVEGLACSNRTLEQLSCARADRDVLFEFLRGISGDMADFMCGDLAESTERCQKLRPLPPLQDSSLSSSRSNQGTGSSRKLKLDSFVFTVLDVVQSINQFSARI